ncbi:MAG TPA: hypothetical protein VGB02_03455 [Pyrinomonadaceae bacterium]|jgi:hypothetical protein
MRWIKKGRIFDPQNNSSGWIKNYAAIPVADLIDGETLRIYFSTRDEKGRSLPTFIEVAPDKPEEIKYVHNAPILPLGEPGTFDDSGIMPSCIVNLENRKLLYYIGWNPQVTVSYRLSVGLAESFDGGKTFQKVSRGPVCDRSFDEPFFNTAPYVIKENEIWKMWYASCTEWSIVNDHPEPHYHIKYAVSTNGIDWQKTQIVCIDYDDKFTEAIGKPCVYREDEIFKMIYSHRSVTDYRTDREKSYRLGYAESKDGVVWQRKDDEIGIGFSEEGWDSVMQEYAATYVFKGKRYLIYNGNGFGQTGFGYAIQEQT